MAIESDRIPEEIRLVELEQQLRDRAISVKQFVASLAMSASYRQQFCDPYPAPKAVEILCRQLLGWQATMPTQENPPYLDCLETQGWNATVNAVVNSPDYEHYFGEDVVPYPRSVAF